MTLSFEERHHVPPRLVADCRTPRPCRPRPGQRGDPQDLLGRAWDPSSLPKGQCLQGGAGSSPFVPIPEPEPLRPPSPLCPIPPPPHPPPPPPALRTAAVVKGSISP